MGLIQDIDFRMHDLEAALALRLDPPPDYTAELGPLHVILDDPGSSNRQENGL